MGLRRGGKPPLTLKEMQLIAQRKGGKSLAKEYVRGADYLPWRCRDGHEWLATGESIKAGHWCPTCAHRLNGIKRLLGIPECRKTASERGGRCVSRKYVNSKSPLLWECAQGHRWLATANSVRNGHWCAVCANKKKSVDNTSLSIKDMQELALRKHGKCLSGEYRNIYWGLEWQCALGHRWRTAPANIIAGHWCPECGRGLSERICRAVFENLFCERFPRERPPWLLGEKGVPLELDGYSAKLKLAFEYQGAQHFIPVKQFRMNEHRLTALQIRDEIKRTRCREHGVTLIDIPHTVRGDAIETHIRAELMRLKFPSDIWEGRPPLELGRLDIVSDVLLFRYKTMAQERGGNCLANRYLGQLTPLLWRCGEGHEWLCSPKRIRRGTWCAICRKISQKDRHHAQTFAKIQEYAAKTGQQLLATEFTGQNEKLSLRCPFGHNWTASWASIRHGTGCKVCQSLA